MRIQTPSAPAAAGSLFASLPASATGDFNKLMAGAILMVLVLVIVLPSLILMSMAVLAGLLGSLLRRTAADKHKGTELLALAEQEANLLN